MRIDGTHTFLAPIDRVFAACMNPDVVRRSIPGCERLIQFGPAEPGEAAHWEMRLKLGPAAQVYTAQAAIQPVRRPARLEVEATGSGPDGPITVQGSLDFVEQDERVVLAYVWNVEATGATTSERQEFDANAAKQFAQYVCERLATNIAPQSDDQPSLAEALPLLRADSARGKIILLPTADVPESSQRIRTFATRTVLIAAGLLIGLSALALAGTIIRRWGSAVSHSSES